VKDSEAREIANRLDIRIHSVEREIGGGRWHGRTGLTGDIRDLQERMAILECARERLDALLKYLGVEVVLNDPEKWVVRKVGENQ
jgi:hypothetical protein